MKVKNRTLWIWAITFSVACIIATLGYALFNQKESKQKKQCTISIFYSYGENDKLYGNLREQVMMKLLSNNLIEPDIKTYYLDATRKSKEEMESIYHQALSGRHNDLIMINGDYAVRSAMRSKERALKDGPVVFSGVSFTSEKELRRHHNFSGCTDYPDVISNMKLAQTLFPNSIIEMNYSKTPLGLMRHKYILDALKKTKASITYEKYSPERAVDSNYVKERDQISIDPKTISVNFVPIGNMTSIGLIDHFNNEVRQNAERVFIMSKFEPTSLIICGLYNMPIVTCVASGMNNGVNTIGGYLTTEETTTEDWSGIALNILINGQQKQTIIRSSKSYQFDYDTMEQWQINKGLLPHGGIVKNIPWYIKFRSLLFVLATLLIIISITVAYTFYVIRSTQSVQDERNMQLRRAISTLITSINYTNISLFNIDKNRMVRIMHRRKDTNEMTRFSYPLDDLRQFFGGDDFNTISEALDNINEVKSGTLQLRIRMQGSRIYKWYEVHYRAVEEKGDIVCGGMVEEISMQKKHEKEMLESKRMAEVAEAKQSFLDNLSHEIRTPLNAIVGFSSVLCSPDAKEMEPEEMQEMVDIINHNNNILMSLIVDILELSRIESGYVKFKYTRAEINEIVKTAFESERSKIRPELEYKFIASEENPLVMTDALHLQEVIHYIIGNANKFTTNGSITVSVNYLKSERKVAIYIADTGKGIEKEQQKMVFERFYKTDVFEQGTGLGLSICDVIIKKLQGEIHLYSEIGEGTTFGIVIPLEPDVNHL